MCIQFATRGKISCSPAVSMSTCGHIWVCAKKTGSFLREVIRLDGFITKVVKLRSWIHGTDTRNC